MMPAPRVPDPAAGTSHALPSAACIFPCRSKLILDFRIHPAVVDNIFVHYTRVKDQDACSSVAAEPPRILGCMIGVQYRQKVDIYNSFELDGDPVSGTLEDAFEKQQELYKKLFPDFKVMGWYSTGSQVQDADMKIHRMLLDVHHHPVYFLLNSAINSQMDLPVTIFESDLRVIDRSSRLVFVRPKHKIQFVKNVLSETQAPKQRHDEETAFSIIETMPPEGGQPAQSKLIEFRRMLLETPSGFTMFGIDDKVFRYPEDIWSYFTRQCVAKDVVFLIGFIKVDNKSIACYSDVGPSEDLGQFILKFCNRKGLIVQNLRLKQVIETKLDVKCWFHEHVVPELTWGLNFLLDKFIPEEKENLNLPLSKELEKKIRMYGFNISKQMIDREFISMVGRLKTFVDATDFRFEFLHDRFDHCFPGTGTGMSETEYAEALADLVSSEPSVVAQDENYSKEDILSAINSLWAAPKQKEYVWSRLKHMEAVAYLRETDPDVDSGSDGVGITVKWHPWSTVFGFGCLIAMEWSRSRKGLSG